MIEVTGNLWDYERWPAETTYRCITTNGFVKKNGECVMGRGCALEAAKKYPDLPKLLGHSLSIYGNSVIPFYFGDECLLTFPVKHKWFEKADPVLIRSSSNDLDVFLRLSSSPQDICLLPRPGCGNGQLNWTDVKPLLEFLPDNVLVISYA